MLLSVACGSNLDSSVKETVSIAAPTEDIFSASTGRKSSEPRVHTGDSEKGRPTPSSNPTRPPRATPTLKPAMKTDRTLETVKIAEAADEPLVFVTTWGGQGTEGSLSTMGDNGKFFRPRGVGVAPDGTVYVVDTQNHRIQKFTSQGVYQGQWGTEGSGDGEFDEPTGVAVAPDGSVYVADTENSRIQKFTSEGVFVTKWGEGPGPEKAYWECCYQPRGVAVASDGIVYVGDTNPGRIMKFTPEGVVLGQWGTSGTDNGQFKSPYGVAMAPDGSVYVGDAGNNRIQKFTSEGTYVGQWGTKGNGDGEFFNPSGVAVGLDGSVYVADFANHRIQKFTSEGVFLTKWGKQGYFDGGQFNAPRGIAVAPDGSLYVADRDNNRIQKFSPGS